MSSLSATTSNALPSSAIQAEIERSLHRVSQWVERHDYKGYDPADGNASWLHSLTFGHVFLQRVLQQVVLRSPWNLRPLLGVPFLDSPHARGYMAWGYTRLFVQTGDTSLRERAISCLDWLIEHRSPGYKQFCWGNQFNYATRTGKRKRYEPIIVWTALIGQAFLEAFEQWGDPRYLEVVESIAEWILSLPREETTTGTCLSYVAYKQVSIHNSNMLGAALLARLHSIKPQPAALEVAREAMRYSCTRMKADGAWLYGEAPNHNWIDNFHTGYNLECLHTYIEATEDHQFDEQLERGLRYFKENFFDPDGAPKYYHNNRFPVDIQSASQAIDTLAVFSDRDPDCFSLGCKVADWTIRNLQAPQGYFYYRHLGWKKVKAPMIHWGQATMYKALVTLLSKFPGSALSSSPSKAQSVNTATAR